MKSYFFAILGCLAVMAGMVRADEVAVLDLRTGKSKQLERIVIEFYDNTAPQTVANFKRLVRSRYYNGTAFHRVFPGLMVQGGDPLSRKKDRSNVGTGGPGYTLPAEWSARKHVAGTVAMARLPDNINPAGVSNGSQFYITLAPMPQYDKKYTVFGNVIAGREALDAISRKPTDTNDNPTERVVIASAQIVPRQAVGVVKPRTGGFFGWFGR